MKTKINARSSTFSPIQHKNAKRAHPSQTFHQPLFAAAIAVACSLSDANAASSTRLPEASPAHPFSSIMSNRLAPKFCAHTPIAGSAERSAIMDSLRGSVLRATGQSVIFVVRHLKVSRGWAWTVVSPKSSDGTALEPLAALMRRTRNGWKAVRVLNGDEVGAANSPRALRRMFPNAPADIFIGSHL